MPDLDSFEYAVLRVVPRVEREEFINAGVILFCLRRRFLEARIRVSDARLRALWPDVDVEVVRSHLEAVVKVCSGDPSAGSIAQLSIRERFHWLVAPRSTIIQVSAVHSGLCKDPRETLDRLAEQVLPAP